MKDIALKVAGFVFLVVSILQLLRVIFGIKVVAGGHVVPVWLSLVAFIVMGLLAIWMFRALKQ